MEVLGDGKNMSGKRRSLDAIAILSLPKNLRKTAIAIHRKQRATVEIVMEMTGRNKENEQECLSKLVQMGFLVKEEIDKKIYYKI
jgi:hypothetical protein